MVTYLIITVLGMYYIISYEKVILTELKVFFTDLSNLSRSLFSLETAQLPLLV